MFMCSYLKYFIHLITSIQQQTHFVLLTQLKLPVFSTLDMKLENKIHCSSSLLYCTLTGHIVLCNKWLKYLKCLFSQFVCILLFLCAHLGKRPKKSRSGHGQSDAVIGPGQRLASLLLLPPVLRGNKTHLVVVFVCVCVCGGYRNSKCRYSTWAFLLPFLNS